MNAAYICISQRESKIPNIHDSFPGDEIIMEKKNSVFKSFHAIFNSSWKNVFSSLNILHLKCQHNLVHERLSRLCLQTFCRVNVTTTEWIIVSEMFKITSCSAWNKDINAADYCNPKSSQLVCFPVITAELITAALLKHSNSVSNNISKDVIEKWINVTKRYV